MEEESKGGDQMKSIYIAGKIAGDPDYYEKFMSAHEALQQKGWVVWNPALLPEGVDHEKYMPVCLTMLNAADALCLLPDSGQSIGAMTEHYFASYQSKEIWVGVEHVPDISNVPNYREFIEKLMTEDDPYRLSDMRMAIDTTANREE